MIRGYTSAERIAAQGFILWQYLLNAFITNPSKLGPFHDTLWNLNTKTHLLGWFLFSSIILINILAIYYRKKNRLLSFAILWFFGGHILESSTISLEFYFEHRNYIPLFGPVLSLISYLLSLKKQRKIIHIALASYIFLISTITYQTTSLWGQKLLAAKIWSLENPDSVRATLHLAKQLEELHYSKEALKTLKQFNNKHDYSIGLQIQELILSCRISPSTNHAKPLKKILLNAKEARYESWASESPENLYEFLLKHECNNIDFNSVKLITNQMIKNKHYQSSSKSLHLLYTVLALIDLQYDTPKNALINFDTALTNHVTPDLLYYSIWVAKQQNDSNFIKKWSKSLEHNP